jgi:hypothetical protein
MNVCLLALWGDSLAYTVACALAHSGNSVTVWIADADRDNQSKWSLSPRISKIPGVRLVVGEIGDDIVRIDRLIIQGHPLLLKERALLNRLAAISTELTAISAGDRSKAYRRALRLQLQERQWYGQWFRKISVVAYKDGFFSVDLLGLFRSRRVVGFDAHSKFLSDRTLYQTIHTDDWHTDTPRPIKVNFLGSRDPDMRGAILDAVGDFFAQSDAAFRDNRTEKRMFWHVYSDAQPAALGPERFIDVLSESDFTLAPPGYSLVTHRPIEALLRGSIPILNSDELDLYDLGLVDSKNCIAVTKGAWPAAMERILQMDDEQVIDMRRNIKSMIPQKVDYPALARNICRRLGLDT